MWAEATGRYTFTLSQMEAARGNDDAKGVDPVAIFGINPDRFKDILQDIALQFDQYIRTTFVADLDNVQLFPEHTSLDVLDLITEA
jgi:phosphoadenosine phosphosulfate reductase